MASLLLWTLVPSEVAHASPARSPAATSRDACEAALALEEAGKSTTSSRGPCHSAFLLAGQPEDLRNEVASLMSPVAHTSLDDVAISAMMADAATRQDTRLPWGYLARCDIARRMGNADTLKACLEDLVRVAPQHPATRWALDVSKERPSFWIWAFRALLFIGLVGTAAHAIMTRLARRRAAAPVAVAVLLGIFALSGLGAGTARAVLTKDHLSDFPIDDKNPEASVPSPDVQVKKPLEFGYFLQDVAAKAEKAAKSGNHAAAARYYGALAKAAPTVAYGPRQTCLQLEAAGDLPQAIKACRTALTGTGANAADFTRFVSLVLASKGPLAPEERTELEAVIAHLRHEAQLGALPTMLRCEVDLRFKDFPALEACTAELAKMAPQDPKTISLQWAVAVQKQDRGEALALIARARSAGMNSDGLARMERATRTMAVRRAGFLAVLLAAALGLAFALIRARREMLRRRLAV